MALTVLTPPTSTDLCLLDDVKAEEALTTPEHDAVLSSMIAQATAVIEKWCNRPFAAAKYQETLPGYGGTVLQLSRLPVVSLAQVLYRSELVLDAVIADANAGQLFREFGWFWTTAWDPRAMADTPQGNTEAPRYTVQYVAGYTPPGYVAPDTPHAPPWPEDLAAPLPIDLSRACIDTVKTWWEGRSGVLIARKQVADLHIIYNQIGIGQLPPGVQTTLAAWRVWV